MSHTHTLPFSLVGQLEGYTFGKGGKIHHLLIETSQGVHSIKLDSICRIELLRSILNKKIQQGSWLAVSGRQKIDKKGFVKHLKAKAIVPAVVDATLAPSVVAKPGLVPAPEERKTKILVCQKSDCCKRGSAQLQAEIESAIDDRNLGDRVCVKAVGCLKHCGKGPVMAIGKERYKAADLRDVEQFLDERFAPALERVSVA
jgi:(2Fe-2S) ferredoxin